MLETEREVTIEKPGGTPLPAKKDDVLGVRDWLRTALDSRATLKVNDRVQLRVDQATELQLLRLSEPGSGDGKSEISVRRGLT